MDWTMVGAIAAVVGATAATVYTMSFLVAIWIAYTQLDRFEKGRKFQEVSVIFKELQTKELFEERGYIYKNFPENVEGIDKEQLKAHIQKAEIALNMFDRIGYLVQTGHIDAKPIMENHWFSIWRCWKKSKNIIIWAREQRGDTYFDKFEYLFQLSEAYRIQKGYQEPKFF